MSISQTLNQKRAADALKKVKETVESGVAGDYRSQMDSLPATIVMNGLGQASAMLLSNAEGQDACHSAHRRLYEHLGAWLCGGFDGAPYGHTSELIEAIAENDQDCYVRAQAEALAWLEWGKKFARAYIEKPAREGKND
jgi:CRISPR-associated protein Cmr5